jgi:hypothetical protein
MAGNYLMDLTSVAGNNISNAVVNGQETVDAAGTAQPIGASTPVGAVTVKALAANTGDIYVGGSSVDSSNGYVLAAGEAVLVITDNIANIFIDSSVDGEGVSFVGS